MVKALTLAALIALSACQTAKGTFCDIAKPIRLAPEQVDQLTDDQVAQLLAHNTKGQRLCGWRP
nr:hypothetical protein RAR13_11920 [Aminobacter aminovorans]